MSALIVDRGCCRMSTIAGGVLEAGTVGSGGAEHWAKNKVIK